MAVNPTTGIDPTADRFARFLPGPPLQFLDIVKWPRDDGAALTGTPAHRYYKVVAATPPTDSAQYRAVSDGYTLTHITPEPAIQLPQGEYEAAWGLELRSVEEQKLQVDDMANRVIRYLVPQVQEPQVWVRLTEALRVLSEGGTLSPAQQALIAGNATNASAIEQAESRKAALYADIDAARPYELYEGWPVTLEQLDEAEGS